MVLGADGLDEALNDVFVMTPVMADVEFSLECFGRLC
jgi:hypothetical protein